MLYEFFLFSVLSVWGIHIIIGKSKLGDRLFPGYQKYSSADKFLLCQGLLGFILLFTYLISIFVQKFLYYTY